MALLIPNPYGSTLSAAFKLARERGIYPTWMGTAEIRELTKAIKERAVFSARTTNAVYLDELKQRIERFVANGYDGDQGKLRLELKDILTRLQYDPVTGFPGDEDLGIPPARAGSLQDLSSDRRINLILDTQLKLLAGKGQEQQGLSEAALDLFPAYELVRIESRRVPREWLRDWEIAADNINWEGVSKEAFKQGRMIALKISPIWAAVGSSALFPDALDVSHPPFRFNSGMGWEVKDRATSERWGLLSVKSDKPVKALKVPAEVKKFPPATISTNGLSAATLARLKKTMDNAEAKNGKLTLESVFGNAPPPPRKQRMNADILCDGLDCLLLLADDDTRLNADHVPKRVHHDQKGKRCGRGWISHNKECRKAVDVLSGHDPVTAQEVADAFDQAPHHHLREVVRHWFDKSFKRLNQAGGSKETQQLRGLIERITPTPHDGPLWRGLRFENREQLAAFAAKAVKGGTLDAPLNAFSRNPHVAGRFAEPFREDAGRYQAIMRLTKSKSGRNMRPLAEEVHPKVAHQEEVIFLAGTRVKVMGSTYQPSASGGTFLINLEEAE